MLRAFSCAAISSPPLGAVFRTETPWMKKLLLLALLLLVGWKLSLKFLNAAPRPAEPEEGVVTVTRSAPATPSRQAEPAAPPPLMPTQNFRCDGRTHCSQMTSCAEATYFLKNCPNTKMDGNGDGVPCERQWCG